MSVQMQGELWINYYVYVQMQGELWINYYVYSIGLSCYKWLENVV
jgi:hypothetical protein